jgi:hypothetical protein
MTPIDEWFIYGNYVKVMPNSRLLLHWPTILQGAADMFHVCMSIPLLVVAMEHIVCRKSPVVSSLLRRHVKSQYVEHARTYLEDRALFPEKNPSLQPLSEDELEILRARLAFLALDKKLINALKQSFAATFGLLTPVSASPSLSKLLPNLPQANRVDCSIVYVDRINTQYMHSVATVFRLPKANTTQSFDASFMAESYPNLLGELFYILEFSQYRWGSTEGYTAFRHKHGVGIRKDLVRRDEDRYLYIHWPLWLEHRFQYSKELLEHLPLTKEERYVVNHGKLPEMRLLVLRVYEALTARLYQEVYADAPLPIGSWELDLKKGYKPIFGLHTAPKPHEFCVLDIPKLERALLSSRARAEQAKIRRVGKRLDGKKPKTREFKIAKCQYFGANGDEYEFVLTNRRGRMYFSPPWYHGLDVNETIKDNDPGVVKDRVTKRRYYSFEFLKQNTAYAAHHSLRDELKEVWEFLLNYAHMDSAAFSSWRRSHLKMPNSKWTPEQLTAISQLYRPDATDAMNARLYNICANRSRTSIANMASQIRREMMARGIYDLDKLPHKLLTDKLSMEIREAKRRFERAQEAPDELSYATENDA